MPPGIPTSFFVQTADRVNLISWAITPTATSYTIQKSLDGVNFTNLVTLSGVPLATSYLDTVVVVGTQYFYQVQATNGSGSSAFTTPASVIPSPSAEMSLGQIRLMAQQRADRVNSQFVTLPEWNNFINLAMYELYDLLITVDEEYYVADPVQFSSAVNQSIYPLPDGVLSFINGNTGQSFVPLPFYKFKGQDLGLNTANNAFVTVNKFGFMDRNKFIYPNTASTIYGVFNLQYRLLGGDGKGSPSRVKFIPTPNAGQQLQFWYIPRLKQLLQDTDISTLGHSGWLQYVIIRAAKYALDKEQTDVSSLDLELQALDARIKATSANQDVGQPDKITNIRDNGAWGGGIAGPSGWGSTFGGY